PCILAAGCSAWRVTEARTGVWSGEVSLLAKAGGSFIRGVKSRTPPPTAADATRPATKPQSGFDRTVFTTSIETGGNVVCHASGSEIISDVGSFVRLTTFGKTKSS